MVVLRQSPQANKQDERLTPIGKIRFKIDGKDVEVDTAWFSYIGDMHIRFVFDGPTGSRGMQPDDLQRLKLSPEEAVGLAGESIKRVYGAPASTNSPWPYVFSARGKPPDYDISYFLDRPFWQALLKKHPKGLVAAVPKRGILIYSPLAEARGVSSLRKSAGFLHTSSGRLRVSGALYLSRDDKWSVYQPAE